MPLNKKIAPLIRRLMSRSHTFSQRGRHATRVTFVCVYTCYSFYVPDKNSRIMLRERHRTSIHGKPAALDKLSRIFTRRLVSFIPSFHDEKLDTCSNYTLENLKYTFPNAILKAWGKYAALFYFILLIQRKMFNYVLF